MSAEPGPLLDAVARVTEGLASEAKRADEADLDAIAPTDEDAVAVVCSGLLRVLVPLVWTLEHPQRASLVAVLRRVCAAVGELAQYHEGLRDLQRSGAQDAIEELLYEDPDAHRDVLPELEAGPLASALLHARANRYFDALCQAAPESAARAVSREANPEGQSHTYGEILFFPFAEIMDFALQQLPESLREEGGVFYDLGSGSGKAVIASAMVHPWDRVVGVEVLPGLNDMALALHGRYAEGIAPLLPSAYQRAQLEFVLGDLTVFDWSDAACVFVHSTCFDAALLAGIERRAEDLGTGAIVITSTYSLVSEAFEVLRVFEGVTMSWGVCTVTVHRRLSTERWPAVVGSSGRAQPKARVVTDGVVGLPPPAPLPSAGPDAVL